MGGMRRGASGAVIMLVALVCAAGCKSNSAARGSEFAGGSGSGGAAGTGGGGSGGTSGGGGIGGVAGSDAGGDGCAPRSDAGYGPCEKRSVVIPKGGRYVTEDGCQVCTCTSDGGVSCKDLPCDLDCNDDVFVYYEALLTLQSCKVDSDCTGRFKVGLQCPCAVAINRDAGGSVFASNMAGFRSSYEGGSCDTPCNAFTCKACRTVVGAHCDHGSCVTEYGPPVMPDAGMDGGGDASDSDVGSDAGPDAADGGT